MMRLQLRSSTSWSAAARQLTTASSWASTRLQRTTPFPRPLIAATISGPRSFNTTVSLYDKIDVVVPQMAESISEGTLTTIHKQVGDRVEADEELASIETDKIDVAVNAPATGRVVEIHVAENDTVTVGQKIATMETGDEAGKEPEPAPSPPEEQRQKQKPAPQPEPSTTAAPEKKPEGGPPAPKPERQPAKPVQPRPSAPKETQERARPQQEPGQPRPPQSTMAPRGRHPFSRQERTEKMPRIRKTTARKLKESQNRTASLTAVQQIDMSALMQWRKQNREAVAEKYGVRLGYMGAFIKATTLAAQEVPTVNASMDVENEVIVYRDYVDVSVAVATPKGLLTPVIRNTECMDIVEIERHVASLAALARDNKLTLDHLSGGNFSISNPGPFGSMFGTPLINYPQSAVFNMNAIKEEPVAEDGQVVVRPMMYTTLTYDHRLIDEREAAAFLKKVKHYIEHPSSMLLTSLPSNG
ncbi:hypothetical protein VTO42DRAFT_303 [Malbranchea cinnamomea]